MYAIIENGGKQYKLHEGDTVNLELMETGKSKTLKLDKVLLYAKNGSVEVGKPYVKGAYVEAELLGETKGPKVISFKYIRREKSATKIGHRQKYLKVKIKSISGV